MSRTAYKFSALIVSLSLSAMLAGCGSSTKEGAGLGGVARVADEATCRVCHAATLDPVSATPIVQEFLGSVHNTDTGLQGCQGCHGGGAQHNGVGPIPFPNPLQADRCKVCHTNVPAKEVAANFVGNCAPCHTVSGKSGLHSAQAIDNLPNPDSCVDCHAVAAPQHGDLVNDNNGVRAVVAEFSKWSHHVTGVKLQSAHCAACHLEGKVGPDGTIVRDDTYHMADNKTHLRNADTDADMAWDPAAPNHSTMDNFCMSCHDANGATSTQSAAIRALMIPAAGKTASATNPFGDTISNRYDKMQRPGVVDVSDQFNTTNNSHHGVKGARYSGRTRFPGARQIAAPGSFANNSSALLQGVRSTIFDAGNFNQLYVPLQNAGGEAAPRTGAATLGDDSTLHCGDCHTVGQWKVGSSTNAAGQPTSAAIGAHGSNNEYLLRNSIGTDQRHTQNAYTVSVATNGANGNVVTQTNPNGAFLVCYNCHSFNKYGSTFIGTGADAGNAAGNPLSNIQSHAGEYASAGRCNGAGNTLPFNGYTTGTATDGTQFESRFTSLANTTAAPYAGEQNPDFGNVFGIQCLNCHNSGIGNAYGGIHGSANNTSWNNGTTTISPNASVTGGAYIDGMGNTNKVERFLPGLGDAMHVPGTLGGFKNADGTNASATTGVISRDSNWEQKQWKQNASTVFNFKIGATAITGTVGGGQTAAGAGCYTLGESTTLASNVTVGLKGPSVTGAGGAATPMDGTWGACDDHTAAQGAANHGFLKRIVRPVTY